jgi:hypothetical protein
LISICSLAGSHPFDYRLAISLVIYISLSLCYLVLRRDSRRIYIALEIYFIKRQRLLRRVALLPALTTAKNRATAIAASSVRTKMQSSRSAANFDHAIRVSVQDANGNPAQFDHIRIETAAGPIARMPYLRGKADSYLLQYKLKRPLESIKLVLVDSAGEHPINIIPGTPVYTFLSTLSLLQVVGEEEINHVKTESSGGNVPKMLAPAIQILNSARQAVPAVDYALGIAGIAAAGAIVMFFLGKTQAGIIIIALTFIGMVLLFLFSRLAVSESKDTQTAGRVLLWAILVFFMIFLGFTVTAFAMGWPSPWAALLGIPPITKPTPVPDGSAPDGSAPAKSVPDRSVPDRSVPDRSVPAQTPNKPKELR